MINKVEQSAKKVLIIFNNLKKNYTYQGKKTLKQVKSENYKFGGKQKLSRLAEKNQGQSLSNPELSALFPGEFSGDRRCAADRVKYS